ncbi:MAG: pantoate--beta-alanine ligase [Bauldia sp.]
MAKREESRRPGRPAVIRTVADLRRNVGAWRAAGERLAMVPTMGALHAGHAALVVAAAGLADRVVVSIFVNPTQFAPHEDFASYPRNEAADLALLGDLGVDLVFVPEPAEIYPPGDATRVSVGGPSVGLETDFRPHFFGGVATVVAKLLIAASPDVAVFGEKDYQQLQVVRRLAADLLLPTEIVGLPTVREADGLALSSRNAYLSPAERQTAPELHRALAEAATAIAGGSQSEAALAGARARLERAGFQVDYVELRHAETLGPVSGTRGDPLRLLAAARLGRTRLIDNVPVENPD